MLRLAPNIVRLSVSLIARSLSDHAGGNFIKPIIVKDLAATNRQLITRFPPEPNGFLHLGHAASICLNFGLAAELKGKCHLRMDDTNPLTEEQIYEDNIKADVEWLGFEWHGPVRHASDYFSQLYELACELIRRDLAFVCHLNAAQAQAYRGTLRTGGTDSPYRTRTVEENLRLFEEMKRGEHAEGTCVLRAKIDMQHPSPVMRDPPLYRIKHTRHHRSQDSWTIYPLYDFAHCLSDALEGITHSLCTMEFQVNRPLYDWIIHSLADVLPGASLPRQIEFSRLNLMYALTSKRKMKRLVDEGHVQGWDDPRLHTLCGLRRRGVPASAVREFCKRIGVSQADTMEDSRQLEFCIRAALHDNAPRVFCVLRPLKLVLTDLDPAITHVSGPVHPLFPERGTRVMPLTRELFIEQEDFQEQPVKGFKRLVLGGYVRLRYGPVIRADRLEYENRQPVVFCSVVQHSIGAKPQGIKAKGVVHWVSAEKNVAVRAYLYSPLFKMENPSAHDGLLQDILQSETKRELHAVAEESLEENLREFQAEGNILHPPTFQFERQGYFTLDVPTINTANDVIDNKPAFNLTISLKEDPMK